jgi:hypothetical protein
MTIFTDRIFRGKERERAWPSGPALPLPGGDGRLTGPVHFETTYHRLVRTDPRRNSISSFSRTVAVPHLLALLSNPTSTGLGTAYSAGFLGWRQ